jgi:hypothetical protein
MSFGLIVHAIVLAEERRCSRTEGSARAEAIPAKPLESGKVGLTYGA